MKKLSLIAVVLFLISCQTKKQEKVSNQELSIHINSKMQTQILKGEQVLSTWQYSEYLISDDFKIEEFLLQSSYQQEFKDKIGAGTEHRFIGISKSESHEIEKVLKIKTYQNFPNMAVYQVSFNNLSNEDIAVDKWVNHNYSLTLNKSDSLFWSFQGSSTSARADWILPVQPGFKQQNYMGMNNTDYGGGIPVLDIWRSDAGLAIGHTSLTPELVSFPVKMKNNSSNVDIKLENEFKAPIILQSGDSLVSLESFVSVHNGDCFASLKQFTSYMQAKGIEFVESEEAAYEPVWCAWGYEREFTVDEIIGTLPKVKELGFKWAVLDDGFQKAEGDWSLNKEKFPGGEKQMKDLVKTIHSYDLKAKLWWAPLAVDPCTPLLVDNKDILLFNEDWSPRFITWWDSWYMSPISPLTTQHTKDVVKMFLEDWDFDGLKMDGQHMNAVPRDYNPAHNNDQPELSVKELPKFFKDIYQTATNIKPNAVIENCPCGCCMSYYNMPYMNQAVSSDPLSSWQIRLKGKVYKALIGKTAYYGDHVELSDNASDFASSFGIGAVLGSKFTWPKDNPKASGKFVLTPEKEKIWKKWISLYNDKMLSKEPYLGALYDIGFDKPETHVIKKDGTMYYAFYANDWNGSIELRGLEKATKYTAIDYLNEIEIVKFNGDNPFIDVAFKKFLLIAVSTN